MKFKFKTKAKAKWSLPRRELMREGLFFALQHMDMVDMLVEDSRGFKVILGGNEDVGGYCLRGKINYIVNVSAEPEDSDYELEALFHELQHVKQFLEGRMLDLKHEDGISTTFFDGKIYTLDLRDPDEANKDYWNAPWEVEARVVAEQVFEEWKEYQKTC